MYISARTELNWMVSSYPTSEKRRRKNGKKIALHAIDERRLIIIFPLGTPTKSVPYLPWSSRRWYKGPSSWWGILLCRTLMVSWIRVVACRTCTEWWWLDMDWNRRSREAVSPDCHRSSASPAKTVITRLSKVLPGWAWEPTMFIRYSCCSWDN